MSGNFLRLILGGFQASGKSTCGALVAERLAWDFVDTDRHVEQRAQQKFGGERLSCRQIALQYGSDAFRQIEREVLFGDLPKSHVVLATGGGVPTYHPRSWTGSTDLKVVLDTPADVVISRILAVGVPTYIPGKDPEAELYQMYDLRRSSYIDWADLVLSVGTLTVCEVSDQLIALVKTHS